jgi:hypothetical protein
MIARGLFPNRVHVLPDLRDELRPSVASNFQV